MDDIGCGWQKPAGWSCVRAGEVDVWLVETAGGVHDCWLTLTAEELDRARGFRVSVARDEFVAGRAVLRQLLGWESGCEPDKIALGEGLHGKPMHLGGGIEFNVAHSGGVVVIALSRAGMVGIDMEREDRAVEALDVARGWFHPEEVAWLEGLGDEERLAGFYRCWTRKEAVTKTDGRGLLVPLKDFSVVGEFEVSGEQVVAVAGKGDDNLENKNSYYVRDLEVCEGMVAAIALTRPGAQVMVRKFGPVEDLKRGAGARILPLHEGGIHRVTS